MEPPEKVIEFLPSTPAKWILWLSLFLSGLLYALLQYLQVDTLLPLAQSQKLSILLPSSVLLLIGAYLTLFFVVHAYNKQQKELGQTKHELEKIPKYGKVPLNQRQDKINYPPSGVV